MDLRNAWQARADAWVRWARSAELDDDFWLFHLRHFLGLLPPPGRLTVDVGCGEGRLTRALAAAGYRVVGADTASALVKAALTHPRSAPAIVADATRLPFPDESADLVIAFMCLHDFDDLPAAVAEAARILTADGRFAIALHHPFVTAKFAGTYVAEQRYALTVQNNDASMTYEGTHRPLAAYSQALTAAGLVIETIREPVRDHAGPPTAPFFDFLARRQLLPGLSRLRTVGARPGLIVKGGAARDPAHTHSSGTSAPGRLGRGRLGRGTLLGHRRMLTPRPEGTRDGLPVWGDHMPGRHAVTGAPQRPGVARRLAAVVAIAALAVAAVFLFAGIIMHLVTVVLAFVALVIGAMGGWYVVSRRSVVRVIAVVVMVAAAAALGTSLFFADLSVWRAVLIVVLGAASVLSARYALRLTRRQLLAGSARLARAERAAHPVLIMNPKSGGGKAERFQLAEECRRRGIEAVVLRPGDDLLQLAEDAVARGADAIGMAGGDGSQALVASVAARHDIPYVCVPAGTRNHFALDLGLDRDDVVGALDAFADGVERRIDLATVNGRTFVNNASLGLYAEIVQSPEYRGAKLRTAASMLPDLLGPDAPQLDLRYAGPDGEARQTAQLILVSNNRYQLDQLGGRGTRPQLDGGTLGIVVVTIADAAQAGMFAALEAAGQVSRFAGWTEWGAPRFEVNSGGQVQIGVDGEALTMDPPVVFVSRPRALRVRLPRHALHLSPAARTVRVLSGSTIAELGRVAAGRPEAR